MDKFYINDILITNIKKNSYLKYIYQANYIISINNDIIDFTNTKKEAIKIAKSFIKELFYLQNRDSVEVGKNE